MRLPLAPEKPPATDTVAQNSVFSVGSWLRRHYVPEVIEQAATEVAYERDWADRSLLVESLTAAFAQRCDHLMADLNAVEQGPSLFDPMWPIVVLAAGTRNEEWMFYWSHMRARKP